MPSSAYEWVVYLVSLFACMVPLCLQSLSDPSDTLIASLRAAGLIMQPRVCFDTLGNPDLPMMWDTRAPIAITADTKMWAEAIRTAIQTNSTNLQSTLNVRYH